MATRRMFSGRIVCSTRFLKMPPSSQNLYWHLGMKADDDGIVEAYPVMCTIKATEDDLKILASKGFVTILNSDMVTYINDWLENNNIRADRKVDSIYQDLLRQVLPEIELKESKTSYYSRKKEICQTNDCQVSEISQPNDSIGKDRLGKDRLGKDSNKDIVSELSVINSPNDCQAIIDLYNRICVSYPKLRTLSESRKKAIKARLKIYTIDDFEELFTEAEESNFLKGQNIRNWSATFDWLIKDSNMAKVLDGNYKNPEKKILVLEKEKEGKEEPDFYDVEFYKQFRK